MKKKIRYYFGAAMICTLMVSVYIIHSAHPKNVPLSTMQQVYEEIKTPYKYGLVLVPFDNFRKIDNPTIFRSNGEWYMTYVVFDKRGYETWLAKSENLFQWTTIGIIMWATENTWDSNQKAGYVALEDYQWGGSYEVEKYDGKYWMSYLGGSTQGSEAGKMGIGMAFSDSLTEVKEWKRCKNPVLLTTDQDARWYENQAILKSTVIRDKQKTLGHPFVMFYNARGSNPALGFKEADRIAMAVSDDMLNWKRYGKPIVEHYSGITGDAFITRINDIWVMFYFGAFWKPGTFNRFACSYDLKTWTDWEGDDLIRPSEKYDNRYTQKPVVIKYEGIVYHFYCAVDEKGRRGIAMASSVDIGKSKLGFPE